MRGDRRDGDKLGLAVIVEDIETRRQNELMNAVGCEFSQGHLFSKPLRAQQLEAPCDAKTARARRPCLTSKSVTGAFAG